MRVRQRPSLSKCQLTIGDMHTLCGGNTASTPNAIASTGAQTMRKLMQHAAGARLRAHHSMLSMNTLTTESCSQLATAGTLITSGPDTGLHMA